jgi:hypothetical protein
MQPESVDNDPRFIFFSIFKFTCPKDFDFYIQLDNLQAEGVKTKDFWHVNSNITQNNFNQTSNILQAGKLYEIHSYRVHFSIRFHEAMEFIEKKNGIYTNPQTAFLIWQLNKQGKLESTNGYRDLFPPKSKSVFLSQSALWFNDNLQFFMYIQTHLDGRYWAALQDTQTLIDNEYIIFLKEADS